MKRTFPKFGYNPVTGEWNDSLTGEFLWANVNLVGCVEGTVRRLDCVEDGDQLLAGEILVTTITNVGCGNATMLLKTGDRVRVDGGRGIVEILSNEP